MHTQASIGRSKDGLTPKSHATCDEAGNPTGFDPTNVTGPRFGGTDILLPGIDAGTIIADKAFDADEWAIVPLKKTGKTIVIPS